MSTTLRSILLLLLRIDDHGQKESSHAGDELSGRVADDEDCGQCHEHGHHSGLDSNEDAQPIADGLQLDKCRVAELSFIGRSRLPGVRPESGGVALVVFVVKLVVFVVELVDLAEHAVESTDDVLLKIEQRRRRV